MGTFDKAQIKRHLRAWIKSVLNNENGSVAVEFAIIAPIIATAMIGLIDVGMLLYERSDINNALRLAAQTAMSDPGAKKVSDTLSIFKSQSQLSGSINFIFKTQRYCVCSEEDDKMQITRIKVSCDMRCPATNDKPQVYYSITAGTEYDGIFVRSYKITNAIEVQVE